MIVKANARLVISVKAIKDAATNTLNIHTIVLPIAFEDVISVDILHRNFMDIVHYKKKSIHISEKPVIDEALRKMRERFNYADNYGVGIYKNIPTGHGLGSGASNAMAVMKAVNKLAKIKIPNEEYIAIAQELKQDVAYFAYNKPAIFDTLTQTVTPLKFKHRPHILLIIHPQTMEKKNVLQAYGESGATSTSDLSALKETIETKSLRDIGAALFNDVAPIILQKAPDFADVLAYLKTTNVEAYGLAGTGATIFVMSTNKNLLKYISEQYKHQYETVMTKVIEQEHI